jgi:hypothetical protein
MTLFTLTARGLLRATSMLPVLVAAQFCLVTNLRSQVPANTNPVKLLLSAEAAKRIVAKAVELPQNKRVLARRTWSKQSVEVPVDGETKTIVASAQGIAPKGYLKGMSLLYAEAYVRWKAKDPVMLELAQAPAAADPSSRDAVSRLRDKLGNNSIEVTLAESIRSGGFMFCFLSSACGNRADATLSVVTSGATSQKRS